MKRLILFLFFLTSCSLNSNNSYWNENFNSNYKELNYDKDYSFKEYGEILDKYSAKNKIPRLN